MHKVYQLAKLHTTNQHHSMCQPAVATLEPVHSCDASAETQTHCIASKREKQKRASNPLRVECSFTGSPCWTRTNDPFGQKHSRPARLERFARLLVSSCSSIAYSRRRRRQRLSQFTAAMRLPKHKLAGLGSIRMPENKSSTLRVKLLLSVAPPVGLEPTTPSVRNIVVLLAWSASQDSLFLPAQALPTPAAGGGNA